MSNPISSPYADFIQEQKKQQYLKKIDVFMISSYKIEYYSRIIRLQNCVLRTLCKNDGKILNKNILEKINNEVDLVLPYEEYHHYAYQKKPNDIYDKNRIYFFTHGKNDFDINDYVADIIISESAKNRKSEKLLRAEKINYKVIHELNIDIVNRNINDLEKWRKIQSNSYEIQYQIDEINSLRNKLDEKLKSFERDECKFSNNSILECIKEYPKHNDSMRNWLKQQDRFLIGYYEFMKDKK